MSIPTALTIAGSDSGGGAGLQADLKTFGALRVHGACAVTLVSAQNSQTVTRVVAMAPDLVADQIAAILADFAVAGIKIGALGTAATVEAVADALEGVQTPIVLDPVMTTKTGAVLLPPDALEQMRVRLIPMSTVLTPNIAEAAALTETPRATTAGELLAQGEALLAMGAPYVLLKGGDGTGAESTDYLVTQTMDPMRLTSPRIATRNTHGSGCTLAAAIAAHIAHRLEVFDAIQLAKLYVQGAIEQADRVAPGRGPGPVHHFHRMWPPAESA